MVSLALLLLKVLNIYLWVIFASVVLSWLIAFNIVNLRNRFIAIIADILYRLTEPVYRPIKKIMPSTGSIDFSPMVVILIIFVIENILVNYINSALLY